MAKICYEQKTFRDTSLALIEVANAIIDDYAAQGFSLTLRQIYYQMVSRDIIANSDREYKRLGSIVANARLAGLIDWEAIEDRTRNIRHNAHWSSPRSIINAAIQSYQIDKWQGQPYRVEVWVEKDALIGVLEAACRPLDVAWFSCRGYTSASEMWEAGQRCVAAIEAGQHPVIIHLGDHDPSGIDMTRDIHDRLCLFAGSHVTVNRIALNMDQVEQYGPPPNPAKLTDSRADGYIDEYGYSSWELDALEPTVLVGLIKEAVLSYRDDGVWNEMVHMEKEHKVWLREVASSMERREAHHD